MNTAFNGSFSSSFQRLWQSVIKVLEMNAVEEETEDPWDTVMPSVWPGASQLGSF